MVPVNSLLHLGLRWTKQGPKRAELSQVVMVNLATDFATTALHLLPFLLPVDEVATYAT